MTIGSSEGIDRRTFAKGAVAAAGLGALGASGFAMSKGLVQLRATRVRTVEYVGVERTRDAPAPRGLPLIPVRVNDDGIVEGVPDRLDWYRDCGHEETPGLLNAYRGDDALRYYRSADEATALEGTGRDMWWFPQKQGQPVRAEEIAARPAGDAVPFIWRSQGVRPEELVTGLLFRVDPEALTGRGVERALPLIDTTHGLMGVSTFCTHFCCVPGFREVATPRVSPGWEYIHCTCHGSLFDPTAMEIYSFELVERVPERAS